MITLLLNNREILGQDRITFYKTNIVIEGNIILDDGTKLNPFLGNRYLMKIKFEHGFKVLVSKQYVYLAKVERIEALDGYGIKYFFKKTND